MEEKTKTSKISKKEVIRIIKFTLFSISAGVIQLLSFSTLYDWTKWLPWWPSYLISVILSVIWNFTFNRKFTFKSANNVPKAMALVLVYYAMFTPASVFGGNALESVWGEKLGIVVTILMMLINFVTEFLWDKFVVFRGTIDTNKSAQKEKANEEEQPETFCATAEIDANKGEAIYGVKLLSVSGDKIALIQAIRTCSTLDLEEAKIAVDNLPSVIVERINKVEAQKIADELSAYGAQTEIY